jgi:hypothetical protein
LDFKHSLKKKRKEKEREKKINYFKSKKKKEKEMKKKRKKYLDDGINRNGVEMFFIEINSMSLFGFFLHKDPYFILWIQ